MRIEFIVPAVPVAQPRNRSISLNGQGRSVPPPKSHPIHDFKASVRLAFTQAAGRCLDGPLAMALVFLMPRPKSLKGDAREPYVCSRNDWDNLGKGVSDALLKLAYGDDGQIVRATVERWYAAGDEQPHVEVVIETIE